MSQTLDEITLTIPMTEPLVTSKKGIKFSIDVVLVPQTVESEGSETKTISLGLSENESLADAEKDMEQLTQDSIKDW